MVDMKIGVCCGMIWLALAVCLGAVAQPLIIGKGKGLFQVGPLLAVDNFDDLKKWVVQLEEKKGEASVKAEKGVLDCFVPDRGCTVWFQEKFKTRVVITYDVVCPGAKNGDKGI